MSDFWLFVTPWNAPHQASLSFTNSQSLLKLMSIESVMPSNHLILCHPLLLPSIFPRYRVFSNESVLPIRGPKYWSFSFSINPSSEYSGLISFRMDWLDLLAVQGTLKSLLQQQSSKASILQYSALFTVQLSHPYMTTGKTIALTRWTFVGKVMSRIRPLLSPSCLAALIPPSVCSQPCSKVNQITSLLSSDFSMVFPSYSVDSEDPWKPTSSLSDLATVTSDFICYSPLSHSILATLALLFLKHTR